MYKLVRSSPVRELFAKQLPAAAGALVVAELFYKFGSFTLECVAFLATWFVFDLVAGGVQALGRRVRLAGEEVL